MNFFAALPAETMGKFLAGPFTIGVSMKPGHIETVLMEYFCSEGLHESKIKITSIFLTTGDFNLDRHQMDLYLLPRAHFYVERELGISSLDWRKNGIRTISW